MEITIPRNDLMRLLQVTDSVVQKKTTMPILSNVLLSASDGKLRVSASDLEVTAVSQAVAKVSKPGSTTVNGKILSEIVRELPDTDLAIKLADGERFVISSKNSQVKLNAVSADEYPSLPGINLDVSGRISAAVFSEMLQRTLYAVSFDETRFNLNGICFEIAGKGKGNKNLRMVATDGHRLALISRPVSQLEFQGSVIVPRKGLGELRKILDDKGDGEIGIGIIEGFFIIDSGDTKISMRLIEGQFPDYQQVVPKGEGVKVTIPSSELAQALRRVALVVSDKSKAVRFDFSEHDLTLSSSSPELGEVKEQVETDYKGKQLSIGFNARYLLDVINSFGNEETLCMHLHGELGPGVFSSERDDACMAIVMPMRLT
ncbi:MAG: DNA polymerase III subunit beta [Bdellovibrionota bacterium]|nr:MAG: DNA polymerase III subunit beta [Bdellovibrionota bacterium]